MEIVQSSRGAIPVLQLRGRFDAHEVGPVNDWLQDQTRKGRLQLIVNLEGVNFIDSTALATLVRGLKNCRTGEGDLYLCALQQPVRVIFELTRLDRAFEIHPTEAAAAAAFPS